MSACTVFRLIPVWVFCSFVPKLAFCGWTGSFTSFGLDHVITCWLGDEYALREDEAHNAVGDSVKSLQVYRKYVELFADPASLAQYKAALLA